MGENSSGVFESFNKYRPDSHTDSLYDIERAFGGNEIAVK